MPVFEEHGLVLFEAGAIVLHIAERSETLLPRDPAARARTVQWVFAVLNSVEFFRRLNLSAHAGGGRINALSRPHVHNTA